MRAGPFQNALGHHLVDFDSFQDMHFCSSLPFAVDLRRSVEDWRPGRAPKHTGDQRADLCMFVSMCLRARVAVVVITLLALLLTCCFLRIEHFAVIGTSAAASNGSNKNAELQNKGRWCSRHMAHPVSQMQK